MLKSALLIQNFRKRSSLQFYYTC